MLEKSIAHARDSQPMPAALVYALKKVGLAIVPSNSEEELIRLVNRFSPECLVVLCGHAVDAETVRLAEIVRRIDLHCSLLIMTSVLSTEAVMSAMRAGASDLLEPTASAEKMLATVKSLEARHHQCCGPPCYGPGSVDRELVGCQKMVGSGAAMTRVRSQLARVAAAESNVLITGESGTGKELAAELIHQNSRRRTRPFVALNCAAVPDTLLESELFGHERGAFTGASASREGKLQHAAEGTLFLDEIGDMSLLAQAKILRAIESRVIQRLGSNVDTRVQVRLIAATNQDLERMVSEKQFRQDLYYRLNVVRVSLPPLRERREDIPELMEHVVRELSARQNEKSRRIESEAISRLQSYDWPGNIRELRNVLESILVFSSSRSIGLSDLPQEVRCRSRSSEAPYSDERDRILGALNSANWNRDKAAEKLSCSRMTLYRKMSKYAIRA